MSIAILFVFAIIMMIPLTLALASYILQSLGMYAIAKRRGINRPWLAWVPFGNMWMMGCISDQYRYLTKNQQTQRRRILLLLQILLTVLSVPMLVTAFSALGQISATPDLRTLTTLTAGFGLTSFPYSVASIVATVLQYMCLYDLYRSCDPDYGVLFLVLSILISPLIPFFVFFSRNKDKGLPPRQSSAMVYTDEAF